ncbi:MAG: VOC family protein [Bacteroidales bacterium]
MDEGISLQTMESCQDKIQPCIWLSADQGRLEGVLVYYKSVFGNDLQEGSITSLGEGPSGYAELCEVLIFGQRYTLMCTEKEHHSLNDAFSMIIHCDDQKEIDHFWDYFTREGMESQCGWCIDKYGLRWQVVPKNLGELMSRPNSFQVMMNQTRIIIAEYLR